MCVCVCVYTTTLCIEGLDRRLIRHGSDDAASATTTVQSSRTATTQSIFAFHGHHVEAQRELESK